MADAAATALAIVSVHGTGTVLGDPIEVGALAAAMAAEGNSTSSTAAAAPAQLSSKSTFGHTEGTAGITGVRLAATLKT